MRETISAAKEATASLQEMKAALVGVTDTYQVLESRAGSYAIAARAEDAAMDKLVADALERTRATKIMNEVLRESEELSRRATTVGQMYATTNKIDASAAGVAASVAGSKAGFSGMGMNQLAFALDDFMNSSGGFAQKLNGISNNLQMVAISMGLGGAWFIGVTGAIQGLKLLVDNWGKLSSTFSGLPDPDELKKVADKLQEQANKYKATVDAMAGKPTAGTETSVGKQSATIDQVFAGGRMAQIQQGALSRILGGAGGSDLTKEELGELSTAQDVFANVDAETRRRIDRLGPGLGPGAGRAIAEEGAAQKAKLSEQIQAIQLRAATRRRDRLISEATQPGPKGKKARQELANMAKDAPAGVFPDQFAERLRDINNQDDITGQQAMESFGADVAIDELQFMYGEGPYDNGAAPRPFANFLEMQERRKRGSMQMGNNADSVARARAAGVVDARYPRGANPRAARAAANADADAMSRRLQPNSVNAQGVPVHDPRVEALMGEVEKLQGLMGQTNKYLSRDAERLQRLRNNTGVLDVQVRQLSNNQAQRGR